MASNNWVPGPNHRSPSSMSTVKPPKPIVGPATRPSETPATLPNWESLSRSVSAIQDRISKFASTSRDSSSRSEHSSTPSTTGIGGHPESSPRANNSHLSRPSKAGEAGTNGTNGTKGHYPSLGLTHSHPRPSSHLARDEPNPSGSAKRPSAEPKKRHHDSDSDSDEAPQQKRRLQSPSRSPSGPRFAPVSESPSSAASSGSSKSTTPGSGSRASLPASVSPSFFKPRLSLTSVPQHESESSSDESIPFQRKFRGQLLDAHRPIKGQDDDSDAESESASERSEASSEGSEEDSASDSPARPLRRRVSLPVYDLKKLSADPNRRRSTGKVTPQVTKKVIEADPITDTASQHQLDELNPLTVCDNRLYSEWVGMIGGKETHCIGAGALFPRRYSPNLGHARPWLCPIRGCGREFNKAWSLGGHFNMGHRAALLHDNGDGTFTTVGIRRHANASGRTPALVISATPGEGGIQNRTTQSSVPNPLADLQSTAVASDVWRYLKDIHPLIESANSELLYNKTALELLSLPLRRSLPAIVKDQLRRRQIRRSRSFEAILLYLTGDKGLCSGCSSAGGKDRMFDACVGLRQPSPTLRAAFSSACCNCYSRGDTTPCVVVYPNHPDDEERPVVPALSSGAADAIRNRASSEQRLNAAGKVTPVPVPVFPRQQPRREVTEVVAAPPTTLSAPSPAFATPVSQPDTMPPSSLLELEAWELAPGRIRDENQGEPENIAFSTSFLSQNHTVAVEQDVAFCVQVVKPGCTAKLPAESGKLCICSVASGKVKVKVKAKTAGHAPAAGASTGAQEFIMGPNGMWKVKRGAECTVENRCYLDAVMHISSVPLSD